ncbi:hypothetical protein EYR41_009905 [Orbilia oligospora]|uniref:Uncharacterized protein n=1 Tax=Orbilia oligospora TaxID=2813651 RepID=A0A8H2HNU7_ORBOL|nr:hypothetical protein EYR41_009905 [Orbilia oligospora]
MLRSLSQELTMLLKQELKGETRNFVIAAARGANTARHDHTGRPQQYLGTGLATKVRSYSNSSQPGSIPPYKVNDITIPPPSRSTS